MDGIGIRHSEQSIGLSTTPSQEAPIDSSIIPLPLAATEWDRRIKSCHNRGKTHTLELCRITSMARDGLKRGEWSTLWRKEDAAFSKSKADKLARVGDWLKNLNAHSCEHLPAGWQILHLLCRLDPRIVPALIRDSEIKPSLTLVQARNLVNRLLRRVAPRRPRSAAQCRAARFCAFVRQSVGNWSEDERNAITTALTEICSFIHGYPAKLPRQVLSADQTLPTQQPRLATVG